jgi:PHD/YefM family antitoxin component YafN of YafNO toxin-antitoxin module
VSLHHENRTCYNVKKQATRVLSDLHSSSEPVLITEHGRPSAYLVDVDSYEFMQNRMRIKDNNVPSTDAIRDAMREHFAFLTLHGYADTERGPVL